MPTSKKVQPAAKTVKKPAKAAKAITKSSRTNPKKVVTSNLPPNALTVGELIRRLKEFPADLPVSITDGYDFHFYNHLETCVLTEFEEGGVVWCDIGIGGCH